MSEHAEQTQLAFKVTAAEQPPQHVKRENTPPRFVVTGIVVSYAIVLAPIVAGYLMIKGYSSQEGTRYRRSSSDMSAWTYLAIAIAVIVLVNVLVVLILSVVHRDQDGHTPH